ncbi:MAG TPA: PQQ-dependent sugar dehydrogenase [Sulfolobales archaeon]|nr:PQQ-dependent sugar dehydrogenase [Sulfolobales archaeon]
MRRRDFIKIAAGGLVTLGGLFIVYRILTQQSGQPSPNTASISSGRGSESTLANLAEARVLVSNLQVPWSIVPVGSGVYFVSERVGRISVIVGNTVKEVVSMEVASVGEAGLLGLAIHPEFPSKPCVYAYMSYQDSGNIYNRVVRIRVDTNTWRALSIQTILDRIPGSYIHDGGRIRFGPDQKLYITTGDASTGSLAQRLDSLAGKILRVEDDGSVPKDNPFYPSPIYSYGHRNPQGIDWHPSQGFMVASEHGSVAHDEINVIIPGGNYGWPYHAGVGGDNRFIDPVVESGTATWAPSGVSFIKGDLFKQFQDDLLVTCLRGERLLRIRFLDTKRAYVAEELFIGVFGRLRDVVIDDDGSILISTSNRDGRGLPSAEDDRIVRLTPR